MRQRRLKLSAPSRSRSGGCFSARGASGERAREWGSGAARSPPLSRALKHPPPRAPRTRREEENWGFTYLPRGSGAAGPTLLWRKSQAWASVLHTPCTWGVSQVGPEERVSKRPLSLPLKSLLIGCGGRASGISASGNLN